MIQFKRLDKMVFMRIISYGKSVQGKDHFENEDNMLIDEKLKLFAVADGVTIPRGGKEASEKAMKYIKELFKGYLRNAIEEANKKIVEEKHDEGFEGYTTIVAAHLEEDILRVCNVGDSSALLFRNGKLETLTWTDKIAGTSSLDQAIGQEFVNIHSSEIKIEDGDYIILATDGVMDVLGEIEIEEIVKKFKDPESIAEKMIEEVGRKPKDYDDDRTAIVIEIKGE